ncbi:hypothetical protein OH146_03470 [Salinibacterium sp. SYSU T00001]|uniref:hypothetical protein n=1 Tax=Homoserinimonas sedimenticola TaxID=2986805 RepID=UPI002235D9E8|nr:hypothetical protein [Salinibacterium sedimenticola]MCW4384830.1 hypothetical protein [Salinibacterium sedimenticola]
MPRSNRPRGRRRSSGEDRDLSASILGGRRTEVKRGREWVVQPVAAASAVKTYTCPACPAPITPGTAHVVAWRADAMLGDEHALAERRHWHTHCWKIT